MRINPDRDDESVLRDLGQLARGSFKMLATAPSPDALGEVRITVPSWGAWKGRWWAVR